MPNSELEGGKRKLIVGYLLSHVCLAFGTTKDRVGEAKSFSLAVALKFRTV